MTAVILAAVLPGAISATGATGTELSLSAASGEQSVISEDRSVYPDGPASADIPVMDQYDPETFKEAAAALPEGLASAIQRDLEISPEQYLAGAEATLDASNVLASLTAAGIPINGSEMAGTELIVYLPSVSDRAAVENLGATAVIGKPVTQDYSDTTFRAMAFPELRGGEAYSFDGKRCSAGFNGYASSSGAFQMVTAGHCFGSGTYTSLTQNSPSLTGSAFADGSAIGAAVPGSFQFGDGYDVGLVGVSEPGWDPRPEVLTWGGGVGAPLASAPLPVYDQAAAIQNAKVCKSGSTTGWTCGKILGADWANVEAPDGQVHTVYELVTDLCMLPGDSGGPALIGYAAVGINSAGSWSNDCDPVGQEGAVSLHFMMKPLGSDPSVETKYGPNWELAVTVERPVVATAGEIGPGGLLSGTLPHGSGLHSVELRVDGSGTAITAPVASDGSWAISLAGIKSGTHSYSLNATWGAWSQSAAVSGNFTISGATQAAPVYRFWSSAYNGHFYTISRAERDHIIASYPKNVWAYESVAYGAFGTQVPGTIPLYRFWSSAYNGHFYTASEAEKKYVIASYDDFTWKYESVAYYVYPSSLKDTSTKPVARFWGPTYKHHFYTASAAEAAHVKANYPDQIWTYESDPFRVPVAVPSAAPLP